LLLILKAILPKAGTTDLFTSTVEVGGYHTKHGTYVAPHLAVRHKKAASPAPAKRSSPATADAPAQPDLFSAPAPAPAPATPRAAAAAPKHVPDRVLAYLRRGLMALSNAADAVRQGRETDKMFGGNGRYEADAFANSAADIRSGTETITKFREACASNGTDADAVIASQGGMSDLQPSAAARAWMEGKREPTPLSEEAAPPAAAEAVAKPETSIVKKLQEQVSRPDGDPNQAQPDVDAPKEGDRKTVDGVELELRGGRWHSLAEDAAGEASPAGGDPVDYLLCSNQDWHAGIWAAANRRWDAGGNVTTATSLRATILTPAARDRMRFHRGEIQYLEGKTWISLGTTGQAIDSLAAGLGLPTSFARTSAKSEFAAEHAGTPEGKAERAAAVEALRPLAAALDAARAASLADIASHEKERAVKEAFDALYREGKARGLRRLDTDDLLKEIDEAPPPPAVAPIAWGMPAGTTKKARRAANKAAMDLLAAKTDDQMTDEDRQVLARYTGRGGIGDSLNEFYTEPAVATAMWSVLANCGFTGGAVLEPSSGTGVFLHTAPAGAHVTAVELDPTSARIAGILHRPAGHEVANSSLERFATQDGRLFQAVIGNVPFGLRGSMIRDDKPDLATAEGYFVDTALDKTADGGLVALIVPTGFMDSRNGRNVRERTFLKGEFLGAHRLPNTAFESSHTGVTSDIVLFRKRPQEVAGALGALTQDQLRELGVWDAPMIGGSYFTDGPGAANVMGRLEEGWRAKAGMGHDITVTGSMSGVPEAIAAWQPPAPAGSPTVQSILESLGDDEAAQQRVRSAALKPAYQPARLGDVRVIGGIRYVLQGEPPRWHRAEEEVATAVTDAHTIAELMDDLQEGRAKDPRYVRATLAEQLDSYVEAHGVPARNKALRAWLLAPSLAASDDVPSEEHAGHVERARRRMARLLGAVNDDGTYSDLVTGRAQQVEAAGVDTVATKLALEFGSFTPDQLAAATGSSREEALDHLFASPDYAVNGDGQTWTTLDSYIGGDMWPKLDAARAAVEHEGLAPEYQAKYEAQAKALEAAIDPQSLEDVEIILTSGFVTPEVLEAWFQARSDASFAKKNSTWYEGPVKVELADGVWAITRKPTGDKINNPMLPYDAGLIEKYLNRTGVRKDDLPAIERLNSQFRSWLLGSQIRDEVEDRYNRIYRGFRAPAYSDAPIAIPGLNPALKVNAYHFSGLRWALEAGSGIIAADVGLGKTGRGLMLAKIAKATGQAKKPTFVVPKSVLANWVESANYWFPGARVLTIGETFSTDKAGNKVSKTDDAATRQRKYHDLQQNDYDFVFISQPAWNDLDVDPITKGNYVNDDFWTKRGDKLGNSGDKRLNQIRTAYDQAIAKREFSDREETIHFGDLGIDMVIMDEGHAYKNLYAAKNRFGESPKFLGGSGLSNRAQDTYFKTRQLREQTGGKGVFMLTATPTKNSPLEIYSMLSHIAPEAFERMGIKNSEDFLDRFCEFKLDTILSVTGDIEEALVTAGFKNLGELREVMRRYIDRKTAEDVGLVLPKADPRQHLIDMNSEQRAVYENLREAAAKSADSDDTGDGHIFSVMDKMGKAALDLFLLDGKDRGTSPKVAEIADNVHKLSSDGGQIVFCDHVDMHERIATALVARGIPRAQIGIVNAKAAKSSAARQKISDDFNAGKLKVVIGNTATMGEGINLQVGTTDIHHADLPWEPASMQQRNGRGLRQGNTGDAVRLHTYLSKGSFDGYRFQTMAAKKDWQDLLWNGGDKVENLAREGGVSRTDMLIMLSANPEEARAKYDSDKAAAAERQRVEKTGQALATFGRFQEMTENLAKLQAAGKDGLAVARLSRTVARLHTELSDDRFFDHKDLLEAKQPALIEPVTGHAWTAGRGLELAGGSDGPVNWSHEPSKWVVTGVNRADGTVSVRPYASMNGRNMTFDLDKMKQGCTPFAYAKEEEDKVVDEAAARVRAAAGASAAAAADLVTWDSIKAMPADTRERLAPTLQQGLKASILNYAAGGGMRNHLGMIGPDGRAVLHPAYDARKVFADHDLILPLKEHREKAIEGFRNMALSRTIKNDFSSSGSRGRMHYASGLESVFPGFEYDRNAKHGNPWAGVVREHFGEDAVQEAAQRVRNTIADRIAKAPTFRDAVAASIPDWNVSGQVNRTSVETARRLVDRARKDGVLDKPMATAAPPGDPRLSRTPDIHPDLYKQGGVDYGYATPDRTVRHFLGRFLPDDETAALHAEEKEP
jgi:superfamily II DNA or RNA helicase